MRILIQNLPGDVTAEEIEKIFAEHGTTVTAEMAPGLRRTCYVNIEGVNRAEAEAIAAQFLAHHRHWKGRDIIVDVPIFAQPSG